MSKVAVYQQFRERLMSGELLPGQFVTQKELAELAGVPVATAREAIQKLEHESLLKIHPQRGIQITDVTTKFIREAFGVRMVMELSAVRNLASAEHAAVVGKLLADTREVLEQAREGASDSLLERAVEVDWEMHDQIIDRMGNDLLSEIYRVNAARLRLIKVNNRLSTDRAIRALEEHVTVLEHCERCEPEEASQALEKHLLIAMDRALQGK